MAKATTTGKKKKRNIVQRMMFGNENKPDLSPEQMQMSAWARFKYLFFHRFGTMVALNLLTVIFAVPAILVIVLIYINVKMSATRIPYSSNLGIGFPVNIDAVQQGVAATFNFHLYGYAMLVPCIMIFALGVVGNLYVMRKLSWEEPTRTFKDFFRGIKKCWLSALFIGLVMGLTILLFMFTLEFFDVYSLGITLKVISIVLASILLVFMVMFSAFFLTQTAAFKMRPMALIRNSVLFLIGTHIQSIIFIGIAIAPALLSLIPGFTTLLGLLYIFIGFSFTTLVLTVYCHSCYKRFLYDKIDGKLNATYTKRPNDIEDEKDAPAQQKQKKAPVPYKNPKKRKKSIDEGTTITPLTPMFRREDLVRLEKEHEQIMKESADADEDKSEMSELETAENAAAEAQTESQSENNVQPENIADDRAEVEQKSKDDKD